MRARVQVMLDIETIKEIPENTSEFIRLAVEEKIERGKRK